MGESNNTAPAPVSTSSSVAAPASAEGTVKGDAVIVYVADYKVFKRNERSLIIDDEIGIGYNLSQLKKAEQIPFIEQAKAEMAAHKHGADLPYFTMEGKLFKRGRVRKSKHEKQYELAFAKDAAIATAQDIETTEKAELTPEEVVTEVDAMQKSEIKTETTGIAVTAPATTTTVNTVAAELQQCQLNGDYPRLLPWEKDARKIRKNSYDGEGSKGSEIIFLVEEEFGGRSFSVSETSVYSFIEFLQVCAGRGDFWIKQKSLPPQSEVNLFSLTPDERNGDELVKFTVYKREKMQRILFNNPVLNQDFMSYECEKPWDEWLSNFWWVQQNNTASAKNRDANADAQASKRKAEEKAKKQKEAFTKIVDALKQSELLKGSFQSFYSYIDLLQSYDNTTGIESSVGNDHDMRWEARLLFPYCKEALYFHELNSKLYFRGQGHILFWMLALSGNKERQERISHLLRKNFLEAESKQATFISLLTQDDTDRPSTLQFFPIRDTYELFEHYAEDMEHVLRLNLAQDEMFDVLQRLSSFYLILFLLERSCLMEARCRVSEQEEDTISHWTKDCGTQDLEVLKQKADIPYFLLSFDGSSSKQSAENYKGVENRFVNALNRFIRFKIERELRNEGHHHIISPLGSQNKEEDLSADDLNYLKKVVQKVFSVKFTAGTTFEKDFNLTDKETYSSFLEKVKARFKKRRDRSYFRSDYVVEQLAKNIGLTSVAHKYLHFAVTDGFLKMLVLVTCTSSTPMRNKEFLETIFKRYHLVVGAKELKNLQSELKDKTAVMNQIGVDDYALGKNEEALKERLSNQRLCCELSDNDFYYIFNPYTTKGKDAITPAVTTQKERLL